MSAADHFRKAFEELQQPDTDLRRYYRTAGKVGHYRNGQVQHDWTLWQCAVEHTRANAPTPTPADVFDPDAFYALGEPMHTDVYPGHMLANAHRMHWCPVEQKWMEV